MRRSLDGWKQRFGQDLLMRGFSPRTAENYTSELAPLFAFLEERGVDKPANVTRDDLEAYRHHLYYGQFNGKRLGLGRQASRLDGVKAFFRFLAEQQVILLDPSLSIRRPRRPKLIPRNLLSENETQKLLLAPDITTPLGIRNRAIMELLYATGVRNSELRELLLGEVDIERKELFVAKGKGGKSRRLPLGEEAAACLEDYLINGRPYLGRPALSELRRLQAQPRQAGSAGPRDSRRLRARENGDAASFTPRLRDSHAPPGRRDSPAPGLAGT
jgi:integrase/recombinase XerD